MYQYVVKANGSSKITTQTIFAFVLSEKYQNVVRANGKLKKQGLYFKVINNFKRIKDQYQKDKHTCQC